MFRPTCAALILLLGLTPAVRADLFVADFDSDQVFRYDSTGMPVGTGVFVDGLDEPSFLAFTPRQQQGDPAAVPEPGTFALMLASLGGLAVAYRRGRHAQAHS